jgi:amidase
MTILGDYYEEGIPNGWSPLGGQVKSPFGADLDPSGSSAGPAVALASGMAAGALGAETMGSIVSIVNLVMQSSSHPR